MSSIFPCFRPLVAATEGGPPSSPCPFFSSFTGHRTAICPFQYSTHCFKLGTGKRPGEQKR